MVDPDLSLPHEGPAKSHSFGVLAIPQDLLVIKAKCIAAGGREGNQVLVESLHNLGARVADEAGLASQFVLRKSLLLAGADRQKEIANFLLAAKDDQNHPGRMAQAIDLLECVSENKVELRQAVMNCLASAVPEHQRVALGILQDLVRGHLARNQGRHAAQEIFLVFPDLAQVALYQGKNLNCLFTASMARNLITNTLKNADLEGVLEMYHFLKSKPKHERATLAENLRRILG